MGDEKLVKKDLFIEKYEPKSFKEYTKFIKLSENLIKQIKNKNITNFILAGPKGYGKKTFSKLVTSSVLGKFKNNNLTWWNASIYGGILLGKSKRDYTYSESRYAEKNNIKSLKDIANTQKFGDVPFRIIIINEAHYLDKKAQQAFRVLVEKSSKNTRFIFITSESDALIDPIKSRCRIIRFSRLDLDDFKDLINNICKNEDMVLDDKSISLIYSFYKGDLRKSIMFLNLIKNEKVELNPKSILKFNKSLKDNNIDDFKKNIRENNFKKARKSLIWLSEKYSTQKIIHILKEVIEEIPDKEKRLDYYMSLSEYEYEIINKNSFFSLLDLILNISKAYN
ncbi:MAG: AAA family ATPase [Candidatus Woesearchaeota archaeon]